MFDFAAMNGASALAGLLGGKGMTRGGGMPSWSGITGGYQAGGPGMGAGIGNAPQFPGGMYGGFGKVGGGGFSFGQQMPGFGQPRFPQYGGNTRSAQMMNNYMGGLLSRRQGYQPPAMPMRQQPQPMAAAMFGNGYGYNPYFDMGGAGGLGEGVGGGPGDGFGAGAAAGPGDGAGTGGGW